MKKRLYYAFMDLEKNFDRVLSLVRSALRKLGVDEWLIRSVMALFTAACTLLEQMLNYCDSFQVKVVCCCHGC